MNKKVIYTSIFGSEYYLHDPEVDMKGWDFVCFTDNPNYDRYGLNSLVFNYANRYEKIMEECSLMQFVTSDMRVAKFNEAMSNLYQIAKSFSSNHIRNYNMRYMHDDGTKLLDLPGQLRLGGTPLDSAILCTIPVVNEFQSKKLFVVN